MTVCSTTQAEVLSFTEIKIDYVATSRYHYKESMPTRDQLTKRMKRDTSNNPNIFMDPIVKSSLQGMTQEQNQKAIRAIEETDYKNRALAWAAIEFPEDKSTEFVMIYIANKESSWTWTCLMPYALCLKLYKTHKRKAGGIWVTIEFAGVFKSSGI